jgi:two-component system sensor histidine kinase KdpD
LLRAYADQLAMALDAREMQLESARAASLEDSDALRTALLQAVSHDLRTPLATIKAASSSLLSDEVAWDEATRHDFVETIDVSADRLNRLVGNLLDMSRLQAGAVAPQATAVALDEVVAAALASLEHVPDNLRVELPDDLPLACGDHALLERALANVVSNAIAWSPDDAPVVVQAAEVSQRLHLRVIDRGPGIPEQQRMQVTRPFQRLGDHSTTAGVGLGLAVATGFVEAMGGELLFDDTPGGGLTVDIVLAAQPIVAQASPSSDQPVPSLDVATP